MNELEFPIERLNKFFSNHIFEVYLQPTHDEDYTIPTKVKVEITGVKDYISGGDKKPHVEYTIYILPTNELSDMWSNMYGDMYGRNISVYTYSQEYSNLRWIMNDKLQSFLKYFGVDKNALCTKIINEVEPKKNKIEESIDGQPLNFVKKYLQKEKFDVNGYKYVFLKVNVNSEGNFEFLVNVELPKLGKSYVKQKFYDDIDSIIHTLEKYLGNNIKWDCNIFVNGMPPKSVYITKEKEEEFIETLNQKVRSMVIDEDDYMLGFKLKWKPLNNFYSYSEPYINLQVDLEVSDFDYNGKPSVPKKEFIPVLKTLLNDTLYDNDSFMESLRFVGYDVFEKELGIVGNDDLYIDVNFWINKINGNDENYGKFEKLRPEMFI
jgi:hypothetical protein